MDTDSKHRPWSLKMTLKEKLEVLGISEEDFRFYGEVFIQTRQSYMIRKDDANWYVIKNRAGNLVKMSKHAVAYHLMQKYWVATFAPEVSQYLVIDIDSSPNFLLVYNAVREWLPHSLVVLSSDRKGIHVYAFMDPAFHIRTHKLFSAATMELKIRGIGTAPGTCEVFPAQNRYLRLPLGKGSYLLDPKTLTSMKISLPESIKFIRQNLWRHRFEELFPGLYRKVGQANVKF
jgi:hypothetical protein